ncbi:MAG: hypothetical protein NTAFB05_03500 [Nitrobacter sp.]
MYGASQRHALAVKFDLPNAAVGSAVARSKTDGQRERVEPQVAARPGRIDSACCCLTPHGFSLPAGIMFPVDGAIMPERGPDSLKKAG